MITPTGWIGGVVERKGVWIVVFGAGDVPRPCIGGLETGDNIARTCTPVFPPRGWIGMSDAGLWAAVFGVGRWHTLASGTDWEIAYRYGRGIKLCNPNPPLGEWIEPTSALQLAIANALVLHARLTEVA
jgi:hypothetical protein